MKASTEAFNPFDLRPLASLNRRQIIPLPGIDPGWVGKTGGELCSTPALVQLIQSGAQELGLETSSPAELPLRLNVLLDSAGETVRAAARSIAATHGQRLGSLIASLLLSPVRLSSPQSAWEEAYLRHWRAEIRQIVLGGGLANGRLGEQIAAAAENVLRMCGLVDRMLRAADRPSYLPLIGAARSIPPGIWQAAAVADFGGTWAKRGLAFYGSNGALEALRILPPVSIATLTVPGKTVPLAAAMTAILADTVRQAGSTALAPDVMCSVAAYVIDGAPVLPAGSSPGTYSRLHSVSKDLCRWFSAQISEACGRRVRFHFAHDADAAAAALAGEDHTAVVMLGSALGVGFAPPAERLRPVATDFRLLYS